MDFAKLHLHELNSTSFHHNLYYLFLVSKLPQEVLLDLLPEPGLITFQRRNFDGSH